MDKKLRTILILAGILVLLCIGYAVAGLVFKEDTPEDTTAPETTAEEATFLQVTEDGLTKLSYTYDKDGDGVAEVWSYTRSEDGGYTWTEPELFHNHGVWPCLLTLGCGVTLATFGRPGLALRATSDPSAKVWEDPIYLVKTKERPWKTMEENATCGYSNLIALDDRTAGLVYSNFTIQDEEGIPHKCIMFRTITVED